MYTIHLYLLSWSQCDHLEGLSIWKNWHIFYCSGWVVITTCIGLPPPYPLICKWAFWWFPMLDSSGEPCREATGVQVWMEKDGFLWISFSQSAIWGSPAGVLFSFLERTCSAKSSCREPVSSLHSCAATRRKRVRGHLSHARGLETLVAL